MQTAPCPSAPPSLKSAASPSRCRSGSPKTASSATNAPSSARTRASAPPSSTTRPRSPRRLSPVLATGLKGTQFRMQVSPLDCMGCGVCANVCPAKNKALVMVPLEEVVDADAKNWEFSQTVQQADTSSIKRTTVKGSQFNQPLFEFSQSSAASARPRTSRWSPRCSATAWSSRTRRAAPPSTAAPPLPAPTPPTKQATAPLGQTACLRTTPSSATA